MFLLETHKDQISSEADNVTSHTHRHRPTAPPGLCSWFSYTPLSFSQTVFPLPVSICLSFSVSSYQSLSVISSFFYLFFYRVSLLFNISFSHCFYIINLSLLSSFWPIVSPVQCLFFSLFLVLSVSLCYLVFDLSSVSSTHYLSSSVSLLPSSVSHLCV